MKHFTAEEDEFLRTNYLKIPAKRMSQILGRSAGTARQRMALLGLVVPPDVIKGFRDNSRFIKGSIPCNKGIEQADYMSAAGIERSKATRFKKGHIPHNTKSDHVVTTRVDNRGVRGFFIRIALGKWMPLHRYNWIQANGPIPAKQKLVFKDGDTLNCSIENLELLTPAQLMKRNSYHNYPKPIALTVQLRGALNRQINKHLKKLSNEK